MFGESGSYLGFTDAVPGDCPGSPSRPTATRSGCSPTPSRSRPQCATGVKNSFDKYGKDADAQLVFEDKSISFGVASLAPQVSKMKQAGVDLVTTCMDTNGVVTLAKEMKKQGLDAIQYLPDAYDHTFIKSYGDLFEGSIVRTDFTQWELPKDEQPAALGDYLTWIGKQNTNPSQDSMNGWLNADLFVAGLKAAGPDFSRQKLIDAINKMTAYKANGLLQGVNWTVSHTGTDGTFCQFLSTIKNSTYVTNFSQPGKPFICMVDSGGKLTAEYKG